MSKSRKFLSPDGLWRSVFEYFNNKSANLGKKKKSSASSIVDNIMACCAIFSFKFPSLLQYDIERSDNSLSRNIKKLFHVKKLPSDTTVRERLDEISPDSIRGVFKNIFSLVQRGKGLEQYKYWQDHYLISMDGTGHFSSKEVHCQNCCVQNHKSGATTYHHKMLSAALVHPNIKRVLLLAPEAITKQDGQTRNDCEQKAAARLLLDFRREHPHLKAIFVHDSLYSTGPHIQLLEDLKIRFIIGAKPGNLKSLFKWIEQIELDNHSHMDKAGKNHEYGFANDIPLNEANFEQRVNFLTYVETDKKGKKKTFSWITDIRLTKKNVEQIMRAGRARWRIENETFNTLKNQGYNFEHNFGHGKKNLCTVMGMLMMLAFMVDQASELFDEQFKKAKARCRTYYAFWEKLRSALDFFLFSTWDDLFALLAGSRRFNAINTG